MKHYFLKAALAFALLFIGSVPGIAGTYNGTVVGSPTFSAGATGYGNCIVLNGTSQYITLPTLADLTVYKSWTIEARIKLTGTGTYIIFSTGTPGAASGCYFGVTSGKLQFYIGGNSVTGSTVINDGSWHWVRACVYNGTSVNIWVDGTIQTGFSFTWTPSATGQFSIGYWTSAANYFPGSIDEVAFSTIAQGTNGVSYTVPTAPFPATRTGQTALYHFDESTGATTVADSNVLALVGTITAGKESNNSASASSTVNGGTAPYSYQWHRSTTFGFTPSSATAISGATAATLSDTGLTNGTPYVYKLVVTDSASSVITTNFVELVPTPLAILGIGDSYWTTVDDGSDTLSANAAGNVLAAQLKALFPAATSATVNNQGIGGTSTNEWVAGGTDLTTAMAAAPASAYPYVYIHLGINDAKLANAYAPATVQTNLTGIVNALLAAGYQRVFLGAPPAIPVNAYLTEASLALLESYLPIYSAVAASNPGRVIYCPAEYAFIAANPSYIGPNHIHPTSAGALLIAQMWAGQMYNVLGGALGLYFQ